MAVEQEILKTDSMEKFDRFLKILDFYHVERCDHEEYSQCLFAINLRYLYVPGACRENSKGGWKFRVKGHFLLILLFSSVYSLNQKVN